jgi:tRNA modification GTPase
LSREIYRFSGQVKDALALLEAHIDFPDDEVGELDLPALLEPLHRVARQMHTLAESFDLGRVLREGISILILGRPNVGKSSLMNAILGESRAIVTEVAGTTRDTLEEQLVLAGFPVRLIDAAGVRDTDDPVEQEGVRRARDKASSADLILMVIDGSVPLHDEDLLALELCRPDKTLVVINKSDQAQLCDLSRLAGFEHRVAVSAKYNQGMTDLGQAIVRHLTEDSSLADNEGVVITERRHRDALLSGIKALDELFISAASAAPRECLAMDLREVLGALGRITGETTPDEILEQIFSRFCIGK